MYYYIIRLLYYYIIILKTPAAVTAAPRFGAGQFVACLAFRERGNKESDKNDTRSRPEKKRKDNQKIWDHFWMILGPLWDIFAAFWYHFGAVWEFLGAFGGPSGGFLAQDRKPTRPGTIWGAKMAPKWGPKGVKMQTKIVLNFDADLDVI